MDRPWAKEVTISPGQALEIEVPVTPAKNFGITFMAASDLTVTLVDQTGAIGGQSKGGSPESRIWFRSIFVDRPVTASTWKIRVENTSQEPLSAVFTSRFDITRK